MLQVEPPVSRRRDQFLLSDRDRLKLEQRLAAAGLDVRAPAKDSQP
jgi:hypothetical protein